MTRHFPILFLLFLSSLPVSGQKVYTKDGKLLGDREQMIQGCLQGVDDRDKVEMKNMEVEPRSYCSCLCDSLFPQLTAREIRTAKRERKMQELLMEEEHLTILLDCFSENAEKSNDSSMAGIDIEGENEEFLQEFTASDLDEEQRAIAVDSCKKGVLQAEQEFWNEKSAHRFCSCAIEQVIEKDMALSDIAKMQDPGSEEFQEIGVPCITSALSDRKGRSDSLKRSDDLKIVGEADSTVLDLTEQVNGGYRVRLAIGDSSELFLFDTGASHLLISEEMERQLLASGSIDPEDHMGKSRFRMANNEMVEADLVKLDAVHIGGYTVKNVVAGVIEDGSLLCGKGFLDNFRKWELDQENDRLILYK